MSAFNLLIPLPEHYLHRSFPTIRSNLPSQLSSQVMRECLIFFYCIKRLMFIYDSLCAKAPHSRINTASEFSNCLILQIQKFQLSNSKSTLLNKYVYFLLCLWWSQDEFDCEVFFDACHLQLVPKSTWHTFPGGDPSF